MSEEKSGAGSVITKLCLVLMATLLPSYISLWLLTIVPFGPAQLKLQAFLLSGVIFFLGSCTLAFSQISKYKIILWLSGFVITIGAIIVGGVLLLIQIALLYPFETIMIAGIVTALLLLWYGQRVPSSPPESPSIPQSVGIAISQRVIKKDCLVGAVELTEFPEEHLLNKDPDQSKYQPLFNILRVMVLSNFPVGLRYERVRNKMRVLYLTWARKDAELSESLETLADTVKGNLSGFKRKVHARFYAPTISPFATSVTTYLLGEPLTVDDPRQRIDAITVMMEVLLGLQNGIVQFWAIPKRSSNRAVQSLGKQYKTESERAQLTISKPRSILLSGEVQESKTRTDMEAVKKAESLQIQIDRLSNSHLCEVEVSATCWDRDAAIAEKYSRKLAGVLRGTLIPADPQNHLSIETQKSPQEANRLIEGEIVGRTTLLSLEEASVYFSLARNDLGISVADHASFRTNPTTRRGDQKERNKTNGIRLGKVLDDSGTPADDFVIPTNDLTSHSVIGGDIGNGKTVTESNITLELYRLGINFTKLLLSKNEDHLRFLRKVKDILVLTPGDETVTPVRFSLSEFCEGMHVNSVINDMKAIIIAAMPAHGIIKEYMELVIELTFERLGWDRETNTPGLAIVLSDFLETLPLIKEEVQYSTRGNEDVWGALYIRFNKLCSSALNSVFGTTSGITMKELTKKPSLILLYALSKDEQSFFVFWFVSRVARYFEAKKKTEKVYKKGLKYNVVIEESHRILKVETGVKVDEEHGAKQAAVETITTTMKESRSAGVGFTLIAPGFSELTSSAYTIALNIIMHGRGTGSDRKLIGDQMNCTEDQIRMMGSLPVGEAVIRTASISRPVRVRVNDIVVLHPELALGKPVTDEEIIQHMSPFFTQNPHFQTKSAHALKSLKSGELSLRLATIKIDIPRALRLYTMLDSAFFKKVLKTLIETKKSRLGALITRNIARLAGPDDTHVSFDAHHLIWCISKMKEFNPSFLGKIVEELKLLLSLSELPSNHLERYHSRLNSELEWRVSSFKHDAKVTASDVMSAVRMALDEIKKLQSTDQSDNHGVEPDGELEEKVRSIVCTNQFVSRYQPLAQMAADGNYEPLVLLLTTFSRMIAGDGFDITEVVILLLNEARATLDSPVNDALWAAVHDMVQSEINNSGSEVAA
ncbi:MAG: ATP-binding protein [Candidatus Thorarchaeota archaeon SMTZ1-45]|nr:MAG: hypothetical protein AM325_00230 [Candidatus Thorarchaeota archaeon SMTZ1-45]